MKKLNRIILTASISLGIFSITFVANATNTMSNRSAGKILLQIESNGEAWYVDPATKKRAYLGRPADAFKVMRELGLGVKHFELEKYLNSNFPKSLSGKILLDVEQKGEAYYIYPNDSKGYFLGRPKDAFDIMRGKGLGISNKNLNKISVNIKYDIAPNEKIATPNVDGITPEKKIVKTAKGDFTVNLITFNLSNNNLDVLSLTAADGDCKNNCPAKSLADYVKGAGAIAGIHGAYFCPPDYADCANKKYYYFYTFYDSEKKVLINESEIKWLVGAILVIDQNNKPYLFPEGKDFKSIADFESKNGVKIKALMSNYPALINNGKNIVSDFKLDQKQLTTKGFRGGIGFKDKKMFFFIAEKATVPDLASVAESLGMDVALNLDGGASSALYYNNGYLVGPNRLLPTAIVVRKK